MSKTQSSKRLLGTVSHCNGARKRYKELISQNELLAACDIVDEMLALAYSYTDADAMERIVDMCRGTGNRHFARVARLVESHMKGIVAHARHHISNGRVEGTNCDLCRYFGRQIVKLSATSP
ncbi:MAG: transposase [Coriobacteriaceae bacterium]